MRAFLAVALDDDAKRRLADVQRALRTSVERSAKTTRISWVRPDTMHLTIAFFASIEPSAAARLHDALASSIPALRPARLPLTRLGAFPSLREPRTIWAGPPDEWSQSADGLAVRDVGAAVRSACAALGIDHDEKPLRPHLTIARLRDRERHVGRALLDADLAVDAGTLDIHVVTFVESQLGSNGPSHTSRWSIRLSA